MNEFNQFQRKQNQTFILVCINFLLFMVLFTGLGYVTYKSASLVNQLQEDVDKAEQAVAGLQNRIRDMDTEVIVDRLVVAATEQLGESMRGVVERADLTAPMERVQEKMAATHDMIEQTGRAIQGIHETVKGIDNEEIARLVAYHILKGLGDGFEQAAEIRKPDSAKTR